MGIGSPPASGGSLVTQFSFPPAKLQGPMLFVLSSPRSGSSLMQLCLNVHPQLAAGQEVTMLMYDTLKARKDALEGQFIYGGLAQAFRDLWLLETEEEAQARLDAL